VTTRTLEAAARVERLVAEARAGTAEPAVLADALHHLAGTFLNAGEVIEGVPDDEWCLRCHGLRKRVLGTRFLRFALRDCGRALRPLFKAAKLAASN